MEIVTHVSETTKPQIQQATPLNDNRRKTLSMGRSVFPDDAVARIYKPSRSMTTSGTALTKGWRLAFERRTAPFIEPLMGYIGGDDILTQIELSFPTLKSAIRYAERQGLFYFDQKSIEHRKDNLRWRIRKMSAPNGSSATGLARSSISNGRHDR
jgi:hypothetical protein